MKLWADFGITAWFGTIVLVGSFTVILLSVLYGKDIQMILPALTSWVGLVLGAYFVLKSNKDNTPTSPK